ncbi:DUF1851 domain-containing protein [Corticibacterium sp. UT-5YL-CI-8]|nr:DUF1851 domain-containing protein [Tianweitania sp. UT-5YL-CI-8]
MFERLQSIFQRRRVKTERTSSGAKSFLNGAYRLHDSKDVARFTELAINAFPDLTSRITCFGADWLGRQFALDTARVVSGEEQVLLLDPGSGEMLEIPVDYSLFHTSELFYAADAAVAYNFFQSWLSSGGSAPAYDQCVGYKLPLFLGGRDDVSNLAISDLEIYWDISAQLLDKARRLPFGTQIGRTTLMDI